MYKNIDGSNKLYRKSETCCSGTNCPFWKQPWEVKSSVRTRLQEKKLELVILEEYNRYFQNLLKKMDQRKVVRPNWDNHNKDICEIKNYYADREHAELILLRQEIQIQNTCNYCIVCEKCKKFLTYSKEYKKMGFWTFNKDVRIWEIYDPDWSYKNNIFEIKPCKL